MLALVLPDPGTPDPVRVFTAGLEGSRPAAPAVRRLRMTTAASSPRRARARLLAPLGWRRNGFAATDTALLIRSGRWWRHLVLVPHQRTQSIALQQGPLARRFRVADLVLHTTAGPVVAAADPGRAWTRRGPLLDAQAARARRARKRQTSEHWLRQVAPPGADPDSRQLKPAARK